MLDEDHGERMPPPERGDAPRELHAVRRAATAFDPVAHVHPATLHRLHVRRQIVTGHDHVPQPTSSGNEVDEAPGRPSRRPVLIGIAHAQQFQIVVLVEADRVVRAPPGMHTARVDIEAEPRVGLDTRVEVGHPNHDVVNSREHRPPSVPEVQGLCLEVDTPK